MWKRVQKPVRAYARVRVNLVNFQQLSRPVRASAQPGVLVGALTESDSSDENPALPVLCQSAFVLHCLCMTFLTAATPGA